MNHEKTMSVCSNAEAVAADNHIPTFDEVYAMQYVQESIESILDQNIRQYPLLKGFKDDLRQEILIHLNSQLILFNGEKSSLNTFVRVVITTGMRMARRNYFTPANKTLAFALAVDDFERNDDTDDVLNESDINAYIAYAHNDVEEATLHSDIMHIINQCPAKYRKIVIKLLYGASIRSIEREMNLPHTSFRRRYLLPLRNIFHKYFFEKNQKNADQI